LEINNENNGNPILFIITQFFILPVFVVLFLLPSSSVLHFLRIRRMSQEWIFMKESQRIIPIDAKPLGI
jgi:hypothetical protein